MKSHILPFAADDEELAWLTSCPTPRMSLFLVDAFSCWGSKWEMMCNLSAAQEREDRYREAMERIRTAAAGVSGEIDAIARQALAGEVG
jgi:hypothetical protein